MKKLKRGQKNASTQKATKPQVTGDWGNDPNLRYYLFEEDRAGFGRFFLAHPAEVSQSIKKEQILTLPNCFVTEDELMKTSEGLHFVYSLFLGVNHPIEKLEVIVNAIEAGVYPPFYILEFLSKGLKSYLQEEGKNANLEKKLGISPGVGQRNYRTHKLTDKRNIRIIYDMIYLDLFFNIKPEDSADMIEGAMKEKTADGSRKYIKDTFMDPKTRSLSASMIKDIYFRYEKGQSLKKFLRDLVNQEKREMSDEERKIFISLFPLHLTPFKAKRYHQDHQ